VNRLAEALAATRLDSASSTPSPLPSPKRRRIDAIIHVPVDGMDLDLPADVYNDPDDLGDEKPALLSLKRQRETSDAEVRWETPDKRRRLTPRQASIPLPLVPMQPRFLNVRGSRDVRKLISFLSAAARHYDASRQLARTELPLDGELALALWRYCWAPLLAPESRTTSTVRVEEIEDDDVAAPADERASKTRTSTQARVRDLDEAAEPVDVMQLV